eukprot:1139345-Pelagomonas_calceolata.AAC.9
MTCSRSITQSYGWATCYWSTRHMRTLNECMLHSSFNAASHFPAHAEDVVVEEKVWNWVVANISLMAFGTSAPEILLSPGFKACTRIGTKASVAMLLKLATEGHMPGFKSKLLQELMLACFMVSCSQDCRDADPAGLQGWPAWCQYHRGQCCIQCECICASVKCAGKHGWCCLQQGGVTRSVQKEMQTEAQTTI